MKEKIRINKIQLQYLSLVLPGLIIFTVGLIIPMCLSAYYSSTSWNGMTADKPFIGLKNYSSMLFDKNFRNAWIFTLRFTIWNTIIENILAIILAVALDKGFKGEKVLRSIFFIPCLISALVVGYVWQKIYGNVLPALAKAANLNINTMLFGKENTVLTGFLIANNWQWIGYWALIYLAGLQSIPGDLYEAATVDGAGGLRKFFNITLPLLAPSMTICIVGITTGSLKVYDLLVSSTSGGPGRASTSIIYYTYTTAISGRQYGYGSAMTMSIIFALLLVAVFQVKVLRKREVQY